MTVRFRTTARLRLCAAGAIAALLLTACGQSDDGLDDAAEAKDAQANAAFPVQVRTKFGDITVESEPQRVVALGWGDAETALALDVQPIGASDWLAFGGDGVGPWAEGRYDESPELIGTMEPELEKIFDLEPDLILDTNSSGSQERYDMLAQIAPVIGVPEGGEEYKISWRDQVTMIAAALGRDDQGRELVQETDEAFQAAAEEHPEFEGKTVTVGAFSGAGYGAYVRRSGRIDFMEALGFENSPAIEELAGEDFSVPLSQERLDLLDADLTVMVLIGTEIEALANDPLYQAVPSVADGRAIPLEDKVLSLAFSTNSVLSLPYALEEVVPVIADAL